MKKIIAVLALLSLVFVMASCTKGKNETAATTENPATTTSSQRPPYADALENMIAVIDASRASSANSNILYDTANITVGLPVGEVLTAETELLIDYTSGNDPLLSFSYTYDRLGSLDEEFIVEESGRYVGTLEYISAEFDGMKQWVKAETGISMSKPNLTIDDAFASAPVFTKDGNNTVAVLKIADSKIAAVFGTDFGGAENLTLTITCSTEHIISMTISYTVTGAVMTVTTDYGYAPVTVTP